MNGGDYAGPTRFLAPDRDKDGGPHGATMIPFVLQQRRLWASLDALAESVMWPDVFGLCCVIGTI